MMKYLCRSLRREEAGFSVLETVVALAILAIAMIGVGQIAGSALIHTLRNRERETGVALANRAVEEVRSNGYGNVKMKDGPTTYTDADGTVLTTLRDTGCATCLTHSRSVTENEFDLTVKTWVVGIDDADDGTGGADADGTTVDYKRVIVEVSSPTIATLQYKVETIMQDTTEDPVAAVEGLSVEIRDPDDANEIVTSDSFDWEIDISGAGILEAPVEEGVYTNFALGAGTYTCTLRRTTNSQDWGPQANPTAEFETFECSVAPGEVRTVPRYWVQSSTCPATVGIRNTLLVKVVDAGGLPISGASVDPTPAGGQAENPAPSNTAANGEVTFPNTLVGRYTLAASKTGYVTQSGLNLCLSSVPPTEPQMTVTLQAEAPNTATVNVTIKNKTSGNILWKVAFENGPQYYEQQQTLSLNQIVTFTLNPIFGNNYDIKVYCWKSGAWDKKKEDNDEDFLVAAPPYSYGQWDVSC